jgi:Fur family transcriptional regulator, stress-responsive regulator
VQTPHLHLVCKRCGLLRDVVHAPAPRLELDDEDAHGFKLTGVEVVYEGLCPACAAPASPSPDDKDAPLPASA